MPLRIRFWESPPARAFAARLAPVALVAAGLALIYFLGLNELLSLRTLRAYQEDMAAYVAGHPWTASGVYFAAYVAAVSLSFPGASIFTIVGGFLFGCILGTVLAVCAASMGAILIFLAARTAIGDLLTRRAGPRVRRLCDGFARDGFNYLLFLRLVPLFPFWLVNLAAALFGMRLAPYVAATAIGILPGTFVFAYFGAGLGAALEDRASPLSARLIVALALLGGLALLPVLVRRLRGGADGGSGASG